MIRTKVNLKRTIRKFIMPRSEHPVICAKIPNLPPKLAILSRNVYLASTTSTIYSCSEKLITEKCKHKANQPEKNLLKIKDFMKDLFRNLS